MAQAEAPADKAAARNQEQVRRLRQQVQEVQQSAQKAEQEKAALDQQLKLSDAELGGLRRKGQETARRLNETEQGLSREKAEREVLAVKLFEAEKQIELLSKQKAASEEKLASRELMLSVQEVSLKAETAERQRCEANNLALYGYGRELLSAYREKGVFSAIAQRDPVLNLGSVKIENVLEEYRDKLDEKKLRSAILLDATVH
jgi:chromosome segregation ATPase